MREWEMERVREREAESALGGVRRNTWIMALACDANFAQNLGGSAEACERSRIFVFANLFGSNVRAILSVCLTARTFAWRFAQRVLPKIAAWRLEVARMINRD
jgi:hypothetical protein